MRNYRSFADYNLQKLADPEEARLYLETALAEYHQDGDPTAFLLALRDVVNAQGGMTALANRMNVNRQRLDKALSIKGNPRLDTLDLVLRALGFRLSVASAGETMGV